MSTKSGKKIFALDDNQDALYGLEKILTKEGYQVSTLSQSTEALERIRQFKPDLILLDIMMPELDGYQVLELLRKEKLSIDAPKILLSAKGGVDDIIKGLDAGADGYISKPFSPQELLSRVNAYLRLREKLIQLSKVERENSHLKELLKAETSFEDIIGSTKSMKSLFDTLTKASKANAPILLLGESGVGKELIARAVHFNSKRSHERFLAKNCAAFSETLLESELFGHKKGSFTGATVDREGIFKTADRGTLFLDEVGEMPLEIQAKFLRVLQEGTISPVGSFDEERVDVRIVCATNRNLAEMVKQGTFREDLYFRINTITVNIPALRERLGDIPELCEYFLEHKADSLGITKPRLAKEVKEAFIKYDWPGNIRELENEIERMLILSDGSEELSLGLVSERLVQGIDEIENADTVDDLADSGLNLKVASRKLEEKLIAKALKDSSGNKSEAAKKLGISRSGLIQKAKEFELG